MNPRLLDLETQLARYEPTDDDETLHLARMRELLASPSDPCSRGHFVPGHFTASAFVLSPNHDALLLIFHEKLGRWLQPGGHIDPGDASVLDAARREAREEVSLDRLTLAAEGPFDLDVHRIPTLRSDPAHEHFDVRFLFQAPDLTFTAGSDALAGRWIPLDEIDEHASDRSVMRAVEKLRRAKFRRI